MFGVAISLFIIGIPLISIAQISPNPAQLPTHEIIFAENFDHAILQHAIDEFDPNPGVLDWSTPNDSGLGWTRGTDRAIGGTREWLGWSITNLQFWSGDDDQGRLGVFSGNPEAIFAVADSDEAEDGRRTPDDGYNVYLRSPIIPLEGFDSKSIKLTFNSNFRREEDEISLVKIYFDNHPPLSINIPDQGRSLQEVSIEFRTLNNLPANPQSFFIEFAHEKADNNWWWVIDDILITGERTGTTGPSGTLPPPILDLGVTSGVTNRSHYFTFRLADDSGGATKIQVNWGDHVIDTSPMGSLLNSIQLQHQWKAPGDFVIKARTLNDQGKSSDWIDIATISVKGTPAVTILTPPYLQNVSTNRIVIMTETLENVPLQIEIDEHLETGRTIDMSIKGSGGQTWFHKGIILNLEANTHYHYQLKPKGGVAITRPAVFRTAPEGDADFTFSVWSDSQGHNRGAWDLAPLEPTISMMDHMVANEVDFGLTAGDLAENGSSYSDTKSYYLDRVASHLGVSAPWFVAWGNHDSGDPNAPLRLASDMPSRFREGFSPGHGSYSFIFANCFFVCIDHFFQDEITNGWLEAELGSQEAQSARFRFLTIHVPPFCERWIDGSPSLRRNLVPLLEKYHVDMCFSGHTHEYERGELNHVHYLITGGGSWLDHNEKVVKDWDHIFVGGASDVPGRWAMQSQAGVLGVPQPVEGGLFNEYALIQVSSKSLNVDIHGFHANGAPMGV
ncbi:MAG: hypothetical protein HOH33_13805, partial [Verrucomicrobia bacterium]|nr:hypothetical protein [Verrucomicrobiota bacterium]